MGIGQINIIQENLASGGISSVERTVLFIGLAAAGAEFDALHSINQQTNLDAILGAGNSALKAQIEATKLNAGPNFTAWVVPLQSEGAHTWQTALEMALDAPNNIYPEQVAICDAINSAVTVDELQAAAVSAMNVYGKYLSIVAAVPGIAVDQSWTQYLTTTKALAAGKKAERVALVPLLHGNNLGVVIGRLNNDQFSLGDSPMRVRSGAVIGLGAAPVDKDGHALTMAHLTELAGARFSVPQWYTNFAGIFWADHPMLDADGGDYQVYENLRVMDFATRRIRILMIQKIADRSLNSSASSTSYHEGYFMKPLFDAAKGTVLNGEPKPGLVKTPQDGDIVITWPKTTEVELAILAAPIDSPKKITTRIALDLNRLGAE